LKGKNKTLKIARCIGVIKDLGKVAVVIVKEKKKKNLLFGLYQYSPACPGSGHILCPTM